MSHDKRSRFAGFGVELAAALQPIVLRDGKSFLRYDESAKVKDSPVDQGSCCNHSHIAKECRALQVTMCFKKKTVSDCMTILFDQFGKK